MSDNPQGGGLALGDYLRVLWRWKWMILIVVLAAGVGAYGYSWTQPAQYVSTATLIYVEPVDPTNPIGSSYYSSQSQAIAVQSVIDVVGSAEISTRADKYLGKGEVEPYSVSATVTGGSTTSGTSGGVVAVTATSGSAKSAATVATAYAEGIVDWRKSQQLERVDTAVEAVKASLAEYTSDAQKQSTEYQALKQQLGELELLAVSASGDFKLISPGEVPLEPSSPKPKQAAAIGLGVGLLVAIALAFLLDPLTSRVRGKREAAEVLGLPVLGTVPEIDRSSLRAGHLIAFTESGSRTSEALRLLRSNIDYRNTNNASSILVTSALAGEGKSTTICNLAITMALGGKRVVLVDGDLRRPRVHEYFGLPNTAGLSSVAVGDVSLDTALIQVDLNVVRRSGDGGGTTVRSRATSERRDVVQPAQSGIATETATKNIMTGRRLLVLPAGPWVPDPGEVVASRRFGEIIHTIQENKADLVLVDSPALMEVGDAAAMAAQVDALVVVVDITKAQQSTLLEMRDLLAPLPCEQLGAILVKSKSRSTGHGYYTES
jgi:polysaccharide biosynthesis transport protein